MIKIYKMCFEIIIFCIFTEYTCNANNCTVPQYNNLFLFRLFYDPYRIQTIFVISIYSFIKHAVLDIYIKNVLNINSYC